MGTNEYSQKFKMDKQTNEYWDIPGLVYLTLTYGFQGGCVSTRDVPGLRKSGSRLPFPLHPFIYYTNPLRVNFWDLVIPFYDTQKLSFIYYTKKFLSINFFKKSGRQIQEETQLTKFLNQKYPGRKSEPDQPSHILLLSTS